MSLEIYEYMVFRAELEGLPFNLRFESFVAWLIIGIRNFFGITTDGEGNVLSDTQNPDALKKWRAR